MGQHTIPAMMVSSTVPGVRRDTPTLNLDERKSCVRGYAGEWEMTEQKR